MDTVAYVQKTPTKHKTATLVVSVEGRERAEAKSSNYYSFMKNWNLWKQKKIQKAAQFYKSHPSWMRKALFMPQAQVAKNAWTWISMQSIQYCYIGNIMWLNYSCRASTRTIITRSQSMYETLYSKKCESLAYETPYEQLRYLQKQQSTKDNTSDDWFSQRAIKKFNSLYKCWSWLLRPCQHEGWEAKRRAMILPVQTSNYESGKFRIGIQVWHRQLSQCN